MLTTGLFALAMAAAAANRTETRIAVNLSNTDNVAYFFTPYLEGFEAGLRDEAPGYKITIDYANNRYDKALAQTQFETQSDRGFDLALTGSGTTSRLLAERIAASGKAHLLAAFEPGIVAEGGERLRILPSYASEADVLIKAARDAGAKTVAALHVHTAGLDEQYARWLSPAFSNSGIRLVDEAFDWQGTDYEAALDRLLAQKPDMILISAYHEPHLLPLLAALRKKVPARIPVVLTIHAIDLLHNGTDRHLLAGYSFVCPRYEVRTPGSSADVWARQWQARHGA